jgi:Kef-type K+ transport system membrane component KefB
LKSDEGELLLDTAELDDISGVALMALLFSIAPTLRQFAGHTSGAPYDGFLTEITTVTGLFLLKLFVFVGFIMMCGKYLEKPLSHSAEKLGSKPTVLVFVLGLGLVIAGAAGWVGLSLPIGALFAGLLVSRHREKYGIESFYQSIYALFVPFFFVNIGYKIDPTVLGGALGIGTVLAVVAILGKIIGTGIAAWRFTNLTGTILVGVSMVPRAEITMVVIEHGRQLGDWAVPADLYAAMVLVSATTCLGASVFLHWALRKWNRDRNT